MSALIFNVKQSNIGMYIIYNTLALQRKYNTFFIYIKTKLKHRTACE